MTPKPDIRTPSEWAAHNLPLLRWMTQAQLADEMTQAGHSWSRVTVAEVEGKRGRPVKLDEAFALAAILGASLVDVTGPFEDDTGLVKVTETTTLSTDGHRRLIAYGVIGDPSLDRLLEMRRDTQIMIKDETELIEQVAADLQVLKTKLAVLDKQIKIAQEEQPKRGRRAK